MLAVPPQFFILTGVGSVLALVGVLVSSMKLQPRIFMGVGNLLILLHAVVGVLGYYGVVRSLWLGSALVGSEQKPFICTGFFGITILGIAAIVIGLIYYDLR